MRRAVTVAVGTGSLVVTAAVTGGDARAATTPPTFGPQVDIGSGYSQPWGVAVDAAGTTYVADLTANTVWRVPADGGPITTVGSGYRLPMGVAVDANGNVYVADWGNGRVERVSGANGVQTTAASGLSSPAAVAVDAAGDLFIADGGAGRVLEQVVGSSTLTTVASGFVLPSGLAVDAAGAVYVADSSNAASSVTKVLPGGSTSVLPIPGLQNPNGVALDAGGNLFVANSGANNVLMVTPDGATSRVGSGYISPEGVAVNASGDVVVADTFAPRITLNPSVDPQSITLTRAVPTRTAPGTSALLAATGGGSGQPVLFTVDPATSPSDACTIGAAGRRVQFVKVGTCVLDADQAGAARYLGAHRSISVTIRPVGLASLVVQGPSTPPTVWTDYPLTARGRDAQGNDLGDVTAITTFSASNGDCYQDTCDWSTAGPSTVRASALTARGQLAVTVALGVYLVSENTPVTSFSAAVGTPIDARIYPTGGSSGSYTFVRTAGSLPPGVVLGADGVFTGSPRKVGSYAFSLLVKDATRPNAQRGTVSTTIVVGAATP